MSDEARPDAGSNALVVVDVGNTSTAVGVCDGTLIAESLRIPTRELDRFPTVVEELAGRFGDGPLGAVAIASVVPDATAWLRAHLSRDSGPKAVVIGQDTALPIPVAVREPDRVGTDRVCAAAAAFERTGHACTVIDFGTAITVDLVDDEGVFVGGAILPGPLLQARALAQGTAALPDIELRPPEDAVGRDTVEAIRSGIYYGVPGAVRGIVEQYATQLNQWPQVVATGGSLELLLDRCDFIDTPVRDLTLLGVGLAYAKHRQASRSS